MHEIIIKTKKEIENSGIFKVEEAKYIVPECITFKQEVNGKKQTGIAYFNQRMQQYINGFSYFISAQDYVLKCLGENVDKKNWHD